MPVTGTYDDGPEWGTQPYTNMFASDDGSVNPKYPVNTQIGNFLKAHGGTVLGSYGYGISPSSARAAIGTAQSFEHAGGKVGVLDTTVPFGSVDFTSAALVAKQKGINAMVPALDNNSNYALATALKQAGVKLKAVALRHRLRARRHQLAGLEHAAGRLLPVAVPPVVAAQRRHPADAGGHGEVRRTSPRPSSPPSASTRRGPGPT